MKDLYRSRSMATHTVTISIPDEVFSTAQRLASEHDVSLSDYLAELVEKQVTAQYEQATAHAHHRELREREYAAARDRQLALMERGLDLGTQGKITWTRDSLHER